MTEKIIALIGKIINTDIPIEIFTPDNEQFGHYSANIALRLAKSLKKPPLEIAGEIKGKLEKSAGGNFFEKIEVAPPGFINFWLSAETLQNELKEILKKKERYGKSQIANRQSWKVLVEFLSANPTGPIHIGNGRGAFLGDVLVKVLRAAGYRVKSEYYVNDARISEQVKTLGRAAKGESDAYPYIHELYFKDDPRLKNELKKLPPEKAGYKLAQYIQKKNAEAIKKVFRIEYDNFFHEEALLKKGDVKALIALLKKKVFIYDKDGAVWFRARDFGDTEDRVLMRRTGEPTYFATALAYEIDKLQKRKFHKSIDIWGADHHGFAPRVKAALKALGYPEGKIEIIITQFVRLVSGGKEIKASKRKGDLVTLEELIKEVGLDAARFFFLMYSPDTHMDFDLKLAKERSVKNPVYYVQYAYVRAFNILSKAQSAKRKAPAFDLLNTEEDLKLIRQLIRFPEIVRDAANDYQVHRLTRYAMEAAKTLHNFYEKERVLGEKEDLAAARLALVKATRIVLENILGLLGISKPEKM